MKLKSTSLISLIVLVWIQLTSCEHKTTLPDPLQAGWKGKSVCEVVRETESTRVLKCTFPPGVGHERHYHKPHIGYTLAGSRFQIKDTTGIREVDVKTGSSFINEGIVWHEVLNIGDSTAIFLIIEGK